MDQTFMSLTPAGKRPRSRCGRSRCGRRSSCSSRRSSRGRSFRSQGRGRPGSSRPMGAGQNTLRQAWAWRPDKLGVSRKSLEERIPRRPCFRRPGVVVKKYTFASLALLLALPANIGLGLNGLPGTNAIAYFYLLYTLKKKTFHISYTWCKCF
jgi:hypothetical protein